MSAQKKKQLKQIVVGLAGNPNSGKTTIFNDLTGSRQKVGNWGGVTVEKKEGRVEHKGYEIVFVDLPGTYSLTAYSLEEIIARNFIVHDKPDIVVDIIDAGNLERNLYLATQLIEMGGKFIFVLNMIDMAKKQGMEIEKALLGTLLGGPVVFTVGNRGVGIEEILDKVVEVYEEKEKKTRHLHIYYGTEIEEEIKKVQRKIREDKAITEKYSTRWLAIKLLEGDQDIEETLKKESKSAQGILNQAMLSRSHLQNMFNDEPENLFADRRYGFISGLLQESVLFQRKKQVDISTRIDRILTNRYLGIPLLIFFIWLMFQLTYKVGAYPMSWIEYLVNLAGQGLDLLLPDGVIKSFLIDGLIGGVGGVAVFLPNILFLFFVISLFEDTGYMARAAFVMDRIMHIIGLHGKSFISMIMGFGCNVPAIMSTRTLENKNDRILTIIILPFMSCSARLPVYVLIAGTFFEDRAGNIIFSVYALGVVLAIILGRIFRKTLFGGTSEPFVMELPPYRVPTLKSVIIHMWERGVIFLKRMGTVILLGSVIVWFLGYFPVNRNFKAEYSEKIRTVEEKYSEEISELSPTLNDYQVIKKKLEEEKEFKISTLKEQEKQKEVNSSLIGVIGRAVEPFFRPLGFSWKEGVALITGFFAKEIVVSTLGVLYSAGSEDDGQELSLIIKEKSGLTPISAYAFLVFVLIYTPCLATVAAIRQETGSYSWTFFAIFYEIALAWVLAFVIVTAGGLVTRLF